MTPILQHHNGGGVHRKLSNSSWWSIPYSIPSVMTLPFEPVHEKTNNLGFQPGSTQTGLYSHRRWLEAENFGFRFRGIVLSV